MAGRIGVHLGNRCEVLRPHSFRDRQCPSAFSPPLFSGRDNSPGRTFEDDSSSHATESNRPCLFQSTESVVGLPEGPFALKEDFAHSLLNNLFSELRIHRLGL